MSGHAAAPPAAAPAAPAAHAVGRPVRDLAAEIYVQLIAKVPDPGKAESMAHQYQLGQNEVSLEDAMISMQKANISFQTTVQVRNKLVAAYNDIMNMPL